MAIKRPGATDAASQGDRSKAEDGEGERFLPREEWRLRQGMKLANSPLRNSPSRRSRSPVRSASKRGRLEWFWRKNTQGENGDSSDSEDSNGLCQRRSLSPYSVRPKMQCLYQGPSWKRPMRSGVFGLRRRNGRAALMRHEIGRLQEKEPVKDHETAARIV